MSEFSYKDCYPNILKLEFLKSPDKNLVVLDCKNNIIRFYILSDDNPGPIKFQLDNKSRLLVFSEVSEFKCKLCRKYSHYTLIYYASFFETLVSKGAGNRSGILSRWHSNEDYMPMCVEDRDKVAKFYEALEIECP